MLRQLVETIEKQEIVYTTKEFFWEYKGVHTLSKFSKVIKSFFTKASIYILEGNEFHTPIGVFYIRKKFINPNKKYIDHGATRKAKAQGNDIIIYRTKDYFFGFDWAKSRQFDNYIFNASFHNNRSIDKYEDKLLHYVV